MTAVKRFGRKGVAVNSLHTFVLGVSQHQTITQGEMPLAFGRVLQLQCLKKSIFLKKIDIIMCIRRIIAIGTKINLYQFFWLWLDLPWGIEQWSGQAMTGHVTAVMTAGPTVQ